MELLAPAGNLNKLKIAVMYGADAVYLAGPKYSLRGASDNFSDTELCEGVQYAHKNSCKTYVTLNAFLHDKELEDLAEYVVFLEKNKVDAVIVSDLGVMTVVQKHSKLPIHLSTQASCLNIHAAKAWKKLGAKRLVLGREVSLEEAGLIRNSTGIEVELFIHGAMCSAYSGNCTISNYTSGRDSNRGGCIQSCRFYYSVLQDGIVQKDFNSYSIKEPKFYYSENKKFSEYNTRNRPSSTSSLLSSKDLRGMRLLPKYIENGVDCIKVEGRMKSTLYAAATTSAYSQALKWCSSNSHEKLNEKLLELSAVLEKIPHRGYTEASLENQTGLNSIYRGERNGGNSEYQIAGIVLEVRKGKYFIMQAQNSFDNKNILEVLAFNGNVIEVSTQQMRSLNNNPVERSNPNRLIRFSWPIGEDIINSKTAFSNIEPLNVVRFKSNI